MELTSFTIDMDYIKSILYLIFFIVMLTTLGKKVSHTQRFTLNLFYGYLIYSLIQMIGGVLVQWYKIDYLVYKVYMILFMLVCCYLIYKDLKDRVDKENVKQLMKEHFANYYMLYVMAFGLLCMALLMTNYMWVGNHQDDGWYLMKIAQAPNLGNQYDINYATGFHSTLSITRIVNTFELDYAFWSDLLGIYPSVFCKATMAYFNYFLTLCGFMELLYILKKEQKIPSVYMYFLLIIFVFALPSETLANHHLLTQQDGWHFSTAIWYGSGVVQSVGSLLLFVPLMNYHKFDFSSIMLFGGISLVLMSKASQALPLIVLSGVIYFIHFAWEHINEKRLKLGTMLGVLTFLIMIPGIIPSYGDVNTYMIHAFSTYFSSPLIIGSIFILLLVMYKMRMQKRLILWGGVLFAFHLLMFMPGCNHLFLNTAIYSFVAGRTVTTLGFMTVISAGIYLGILFSQYQMKEILIKWLYLGGTACVVLVFLISHQINLGLTNSFLLLKENPRLVPESTIELSEALAEIANGSELTVLSESWVTCGHNHAHAMATSLRIESTDIKVISAVHRFGDMDDDVIYKDFDLEKQMIFEDFVKYNNNKKKIEKLRKLLKKYPVDIIVTSKKDVAASLQEHFGYEVLRTVSTENEIFTYYILSYQ